jgi:uncharacterized protein (TIGR00255 family)
MTGFGQAVERTADVMVAVEIRTVNHRFVDIALRLPKELTVLEDEVRRLLQEHLRRGRIEVSVAVNTTDSGNAALQVNWQLLEQLWRFEKEVAERMAAVSQDEVRTSRATPFQWLSFPGVLAPAEPSWTPSQLRPLVLQAVTAACSEVVAMRRREGERIAADLLRKVDRVEELVAAMRARQPGRVEAERRRLSERLREWVGTVDTDRLATELALFADRVSIDEELTRLDSHLQEFRDSLAGGSPVGRRLDFIVQELHREVNTIGAKAADADIARAVVDAKTLIEQLREQVQNIE